MRIYKIKGWCPPAAAKGICHWECETIYAGVLSNKKSIKGEVVPCEVNNGCKAVSFNMDITKPAEVNSVVQKVLEQFGKIDILVNNAGVCYLVPFVDMTDELRDKTTGC